MIPLSTEAIGELTDIDKQSKRNHPQDVSTFANDVDIMLKD